MPPPTGVVSGPLIATRKWLIASTVSSGSQVPCAVEGLLAGHDLDPRDLLLAAVGLLDRGIEHALRRPPDVRAGAVPLDERDDRLVRNLDRLAVPPDALSPLRNAQILQAHLETPQHFACPEEVTRRRSLGQEPGATCAGAKRRLR